MPSGAFLLTQKIRPPCAYARRGIWGVGKLTFFVVHNALTTTLCMNYYEQKRPQTVTYKCINSDEQTVNIK